jgi:hypothetical protein
MTTDSSWDKLVEKSQYHFDTGIMDPRWDTIIKLGQLDASDWVADVNAIIEQSRPANWETRGFKGEGVEVPGEELVNEEYDLERIGVDPKVIITNLSWQLSPRFQAISDAFGLADVMNRIHVQMPGQVWHLHIDKLYKWFPSDPDRVMRLFIALTDWEMGQFWGYGNYNYSGWKAGDVTTFDWQNVPHSTANAGFHPRVTLQITGIKTDKTEAYLADLAKTL